MAITTLWNTMIRDTDVTFTTELKLHEDVEGIIVARDRSVLVAEHNGDFAGFALIGPFRGGTGYRHTVEHTVYLRSEAYGLGLGRALISQLTQNAVETGYHVMVGAISGNNFAAINFHKSIGFEQVGHMPQVGRKNGIWHDLILMQKTL